MKVPAFVEMQLLCIVGRGVLQATFGVPSCEFVTTAKLLGHQLRFHKRSNDKSSKCDAFHSGVDTDIIWGTVFNISAAEKKALDKAEGLGSSYNETTVDLITPAGAHLRTITYYADDKAIVDGFPNRLTSHRTAGFGSRMRLSLGSTRSMNSIRTVAGAKGAPVLNKAGGRCPLYCAPQLNR